MNALCPDKATGHLRLDRVLYSAVHYPANYGFIPRTYRGDGDPLDVLILCQEPVVPLCLMRGRPIGVITMSDEKGQDAKSIAVSADDPEFEDYEAVRELPSHRMAETRQFLFDYKLLEGKKTRVGPLRGAEAARRVILAAVLLYQEETWPTLGSPAGESLPSGKGKKGARGA